MTRESIDTNVLLRLTLKDVPAQHDKAKKLISGTKKRFDVADIAIIEYVYALESYYEFHRLQINEMVRFLMNLENLNVNRKLFSESALLYLVRPKLSFTDCCLATYAALNEAVPLWTFDKKLAIQSGVAKEL